MDSIMSNGPDKVLEKTLQDLQIRAAVEATVQSMLVDVEVAASLQQKVDTQSQLASLQEQVSQYEVALQEEQAVKSHKRQEQSSLADSLVQQLWSLSQELGQLRRWKETHETTVTEHDEVIAKLLQAEEQIRVLETRSGAAPSSGGNVLNDSTTAGDSKTVSISADPSSTKDSPITIDSIAPAVKNTDEAVKETEKELDALLADVDPYEGNVDGIQPSEQVAAKSAVLETTDTASSPNAGKETPVEVDAPADNAVVALLQDDDDVPTLDTLSMKVLTEIFEFLDAVEILNSAQINIAMYSRVDALFNPAGGENAAEGVAATAAASTEEAPSAPPAVVTTSTIATIPPADPSPAQLNRTPLAAAPAAKMPAPQPASNTIATPTVAPKRGGIFSLLQARGSGASPKSRRGTATTDQPLSAAMTNSMVSKLNDKELSAIFSLTEKLQQREKAVAALTAEKEELMGKLEGMEGLKGFLIKKVRDVEQSLRKSQEDEMKVTQQISSDQEVIAFLDGRVQELERDIKSLSDDKKDIEEKMIRVQSMTDKKIEVLGDMLQFERERVSENEREWKATKKLLVKEIKSCRAQLLALQAERDGFREQNERLKKAVLLTNPSNGGM